MKIKSIKMAVAVAMLSTLTACTSNSLIKKESDLITARASYNQPKDVLAIISQESQEALNAQKRLVAFRQADNKKLAINSRQIESDELLVDYIGKPQPLISSIAIEYGYRFVEVGVRQELPTVNFTNLYITPEMTLVDLSAKISPMASIAINKDDKIITLVYGN